MRGARRQDAARAGTTREGKTRAGRAARAGGQDVHREEHAVRSGESKVRASRQDAGRHHEELRGRHQEELHRELQGRGARAVKRVSRLAVGGEDAIPGGRLNFPNDRWTFAGRLRFNTRCKMSLKYAT
jgi:hypothetical protein